jgi:hypothetical protein
MGNDRPALLEGEDLFAKHVLSRQAFDLGKLERQAQRASVDHFDPVGQTIEIDQLQQIGKLDFREELFNLLLPGNLGQLLAADLSAQLIDVGQPLHRVRTHVVGKRVVRAERFEQ